MLECSKIIKSNNEMFRVFEICYIHFFYNVYVNYIMNYQD